jgi:hypothetical protein
VPEVGLAVKTVQPGELLRMITQGEFVSQLHLGALFLAQVRSLLTIT